MKSLNLELQISLPTGQKITLVNHTLSLTALEAYAVEAIMAATGGKLAVDVDASVTAS